MVGCDPPPLRRRPSSLAADALLYYRTNTLGLPAMICHATVNAIGGSHLFTFFDGAEQTSLRWINAILWVLVAVALPGRGRLGADRGQGDSR